jgi:hypothetical protein
VVCQVTQPRLLVTVGFSPVESEIHDRVVGVEVFVDELPEQLPLQDLGAHRHAVVWDHSLIASDLHWGSSIGQRDPFGPEHVHDSPGESPIVVILGKRVGRQKGYILPSELVNNPLSDFGRTDACRELNNMLECRRFGHPSTVSDFYTRVKRLPTKMVSCTRA